MLTFLGNSFKKQYICTRKFNTKFDMQKITLIGRLGRDAAIRETQDGGKVVSFTVACNGRYRGVEKTSWYEVSTFNYERYKNMVQYLTKGSSVVVVGELDADIDEGRDGVKRCRRSVTADSIEFNSNGSSGNTQNSTVSESAPAEHPKATAKPTAEEVPADTEVTVPKRSRKATAAAEPAPAPVEPASAPEDDGENPDDLPF